MLSLATALLLGALGGLAAGALDWRRLLINGDFLAPAYLDRIWAAAVTAGAASGFSAGLLLLAVLAAGNRQLRRRVTDLAGRGRVALILLAVLLVAYGTMRLATPLLEAGVVIRKLDRTAEAIDGGPRGAGSNQAAEGARRPPVVLIVLDTVRADHLSLYGYERRTTPNLERLAREALVCQEARASSSWTVPSHASLFTGRYSFEHGLHRTPSATPATAGLASLRSLAPGSQTLAGMLRDGGYQTAAFVANPFLGPRFGLDSGFQMFHDSRNLNSTVRLLTEPIVGCLFGPDLLTSFRRRTLSARQVNGRVLHWLDLHAAPPFFLFVNYMDAHRPCRPDPPYDRWFPGSDEGFAGWDIFDRLILRGARGPTPQELAHLHAGYDGAIRCLDAALGELFQRLESLGLYDQSLIVVTSDHGEYFGEHSLVEHAVDVYEEVLHIPLVVKFPSASRTGRLQAPANLVDLLPTIAEAVGLDVPGGLSGVPLGMARHDPVIGESYDTRFVDRGPVEGGRRAEWVFRVRRAFYFDEGKFIHSTDQAHELYDLAADPSESINLLKGNPKLLDRFLPRVEWVIARAEDDDREAPPPQPLDDDLRRHLEELGYLDPDAERHGVPEFD